jgi:quinol monooxygenase YgiN
MTVVVLEGYIEVPDADAEIVSAALPVHIKLTQEEPGCLEFSVTKDKEIPGRYNVYERFTDTVSFEAHQQRVRESYWGSVTKNVARHYTITEES